MMGLRIIGCHNCQKPTLQGFTCSGCRDKGHTDLNCVACEVIAAKFKTKLQKIAPRSRRAAK